MIYIFRGDSTVFADVLKFLTFKLNTGLDLAGWTAEFKLGTVVKQVQDISSKEFEVVLKSSETAVLPLGNVKGSLRLFDNKGHVKTVSNDIIFCVVNKVINNKHDIISLELPKSTGIDIDLEIGTGYVTSVNGKTGAVELTPEDFGLTPIVIEDLDSSSIKLDIAESNALYKFGTINTLNIGGIEQSLLPTTFLFKTGIGGAHLILPDNMNKVDVPEWLPENQDYTLEIKNNIADLKAVGTEYSQKYKNLTY